MNLDELEKRAAELNAYHTPLYSPTEHLTPDPSALRNYFNETGDALMLYRTMQERELKEGCEAAPQRAFQMRVTREVASEMMGTRVPIDDVLEQQRWHLRFNTLEILFEDTTLPTVLLTSATTGALSEWFDRNQYGYLCWDENTVGQYILTYQMRSANASANRDQLLKRWLTSSEFALMSKLVERTVVGLSGPVHNMERVLRQVEQGNDDDTIPLGNPFMGKLDAREGALTAELYRLCAKVLLYASTPQAGELSPVARSDMRRDGKPGHAGRPEKLKAYRVTYLPGRDRASGEGDRDLVAKHGRVAHFHYLRHERWRHKRGQLIYVSGTADPRTGVIPRRQEILKVRKP